MLKHATVKYAFLSSASSWIAHLGPHWFISFPEHLCRSDFPDTFIVYNTKDEKHNRQNEATDLQETRKERRINVMVGSSKITCNYTFSSSQVLNLHVF